jgi:hypothetical protein
MALEETRFGIRVLPDPVPVTQRLRHDKPAWWVVDLPALKALLERHHLMEEKRERPEAAPDITHSWVGDGVKRQVNG